MEFEYTISGIEGYLMACEEYGWLVPPIEKLYEVALKVNWRNSFDELPDYDAKGMKELAEEYLEKYTERRKGQPTGRKYKVNPFCPFCGEEHNWITVELTFSEQEEMDTYYAERSEMRGLELSFEEVKNPPLVIRRTFKCNHCGKDYEKGAVVIRSQEIGNPIPGRLQMGMTTV